MWYLKVFLLFLLVAAVLLFGLANRGQIVAVRWWGLGEAATQMDLVTALFGAFALGGLCFLVIGFVRELRLRQQVGRFQRETERMRRELNALRTAPLEGPLPGTDLAAVDALGDTERD